MDFKLFFKCLIPHRESGLASGWAIGHTGDTCKCERCGYIRRGIFKTYNHRFGGNYECELGDWAHSWMDQASNGGDCERCSKCGKTRANAHNWIGCRCGHCGKIRAEYHHWTYDRLATESDGGGRHRCEICYHCGERRWV
jgi:hypothetical protein